jgi:hypothetical protein
MDTKVYMTSRRAKIRWNGKEYERVVYEFMDDESRWWRDCVRLGGMSLYTPNAFVPLDTFDEYRVFEEAVMMPGRWVPR